MEEVQKVIAKLKKIKVVALLLWSKCNGCRIRHAILIASVITVITFTTIFVYVYRSNIRDIVIATVIIIYCSEKKTKFISADYEMATRVAEIMTEVLTVTHAEVGIRKPYDVYSVWKHPTKNGEVWTYHAKARQSDTVQLDNDSLEEYAALINGRARDISAPLAVTDIHPRGNTFVYDISVTEAAMSYLTPKEVEAIDRDF